MRVVLAEPTKAREVRSRSAPELSQTRTTGVWYMKRKEIKRASRLLASLEGAISRLIKLDISLPIVFSLLRLKFKEETERGRERQREKEKERNRKQVAVPT